MVDADSSTIRPRFDPGPVADKDDASHRTTTPIPAPSHVANITNSNMQQEPAAMAGDETSQTRRPTDRDATFSRVPAPNTIANSTQRDQAMEGVVGGSASAPAFLTQQAAGPCISSGSNSEHASSSSTNDADRVFTPPASERGRSPGNGSSHLSSQESQLHQLSHIAAAQERILDVPSRKRMADGMVKNASPGRAAGHSRNTSTVSVASTSGSRIGELSAELKARLSYAMVKVTNGWQSHTIDQVETLASQAASPASSTSTIHMRNGSSASPQLSSASHRGSNNTTPATGPQHQFPGRLDPLWRGSPQSGSSSPVKTASGLAPPVSIQPAQHLSNPRRNSHPKHSPAFLSGPQASPNAGPHTPGQASPYIGGAMHRHRTSLVDPIFSPHQNVREQDAIESLLFMSSPGNSANLKHAFPSSSQPLSSSQGGTHRTALPASQPRKSLPSGRPTHMRSQSHVQKRVGFNDMDLDEQPPYAAGASPMSRGTPRRRLNGAHGEVHGSPAAVPRLKQLPMSAGLTVVSRPRPALADEDIDRMLDRAAAAADDSDSDGEIRIPAARVRRDGAPMVSA